MGNARRRSLALQTPRNLTGVRGQVRTPPPAVQQRTCLMSRVGCRVSFPVLGNDGRLMCSEHWRHVSQELREKLQAQFVATTAAFKSWDAVQMEAITAVRKATGTID